MMIFATGEPITTFLIYTAVSVALSYAAGKLLNKRPEEQKEPEITRVSTRGTYITWHMGTEKITPVFCWAGDRVKRKERAEGAKGGASSSPKVDVWYESGMHALCVGPADAMQAIKSNNEVIMSGPITKDSHPSGTLVDLGKEGSFLIYWGEENQPVNTYLGAATRLGIESRWRTVCYVVWINKRLGQSAVWPSLEYIVERRPQETQLSDTSGWILPTKTLDGLSVPIESVVNGIEGVGYFRVAANLLYAMPPTTVLRLAGNAIADQDLEVLKSEPVEVLKSKPFVGGSVYTKIFPVGGLSGADAAGTLQIYTDDNNEGANPAHVVAEALFDPWPHGLGLDDTFWDVDALEQMGTDMLAEDMRCSTKQIHGSLFSDVVAEALDDLGYVLPLDHSTGLLKFVSVRTPASTQTIPHDALQNVPEITAAQTEQEAQNLIFSFRDRQIDWRKMTFKVDDDGQAGYLAHKGYKTIAINFTNVGDVAAIMAERRSQEVLGRQAQARFELNRGGRTLIPGDALTVAGFPEVMRVVGNQVDTESSVVNLTLAVDADGVDASGFSHGRADPDSGVLPVAPDLGALLVEIPEYILEGDPQTVVIPRIRAHAQVTAADVYLSPDDSTYTLFGVGANAVPGGALTEAIAADDAYYQAQGPTMDILGPDVSEILNLTGDETSWGLGRQVAFIGGEIFFLKNVTALGGDSYRLDGLIRARYDTQRAAHSVGDKVFIMRNDVFFAIRDILLQPSTNIYAKAQPKGVGAILLSSIYREAILPLYGKGVRPVPISGLRVTAPQHLVRAYATGEDVTVVWDYAATLGPGTGAGMQGAGTAVGQAPPDGQFKMEILNTSDVVQRTEVLDDPTYTYTNVNLQADLGGEVDFKVRITQLRNGYSSDSVTITVEKV